MAAKALLALAAEDRQAGNDVIAGLDIVDSSADRLNDPGRLVAHDDRQLGPEQTLHEVQVAVTEPGPDGLDQHLAGARFVYREILDDQVPRLFGQYRCLHDRSPSRLCQRR